MKLLIAYTVLIVQKPPDHLIIACHLEMGDVCGKVEQNKLYHEIQNVEYIMINVNDMPYHFDGENVQQNIP